jgi:prolyl-tRNA synthetase
MTKKYRDESRPKHGMMRGREFIMKDLYSFHSDEVSADDTYNKMCKAYETIFSRIDLSLRKVNACVGNMGGSKSHEYHIQSEIGEDKVIFNSIQFNLK